MSASNDFILTRCYQQATIISLLDDMALMKRWMGWALGQLTAYGNTALHLCVCVLHGGGQTHRDVPGQVSVTVVGVLCFV